MLQKISHRLIALIAVAAVSLLLVGLNSLVQIRGLSTKLDTAVDNSLPSVIVLSRAQSHFLELRIDILTHLIQDDPEQMTVIESKVEQDIAEVRKALKDYEPFVYDDKDRQLLAAGRDAAEAYFKALVPVVQLSRNSKKEEAVELTSRELRPLGQKAIAAFDAHMQYNADGAQEDQQEAIKAGHLANTMAATIIVVGLGLLAWVAFGTYRGVVGTALRARDDVIQVVRDLDFSRPLEVSGQSELSELLRALNQLIERLRDGLSAVRENADSLADASAQLATASTQVQHGSGAQSDAASSMAASVEEMTVSINHVSDRTSEASNLTRESGEQAAGGRSSVSNIATRVGGIAQLVDEAVSELGRLEDSGRQISTVVAVIKDVADQTNLLALNAAIEAARAGEQGRGFAVVADEVRKLAERTASSTVEIASMVQAIQQRSAQVASRMNEAADSVREGVSEADSASASMEQIAHSADRSSNLVGEIANALREQSVASNAIAGQVEKVAHMADENNHAASRSAELADELQRLARAMQQTVSAYRLR